MKSKFTYIAFFIIFVSQTFSQGLTQKGAASISGTALFSYYSYSDNEETANDNVYISFQPGMTYFLLDNLEAGAILQLTYSSDTKYYIESNYYWGGIYIDKKKVETRQYGAGPFIAYYIGQSEYRPFIAASCLYNYVGYTTDNFVDQDNFHSSIALNVGIGLLIPVGEKFAVTPLVQYQKVNYQQTRYAITPFGKIVPNEETISFGAQLKMFL
ncbi:MAG TPA: hypothetical protein VHO28_14465 [Ignavibacteriales bacterium]|nr:hypothetical protein [Ignavibacteriales bacterium]